MKKALCLLVPIFMAMFSAAFAAVPAAPDGLIARSAGTNTINLSWNDKSADETGFRIYRKTGTGSFVLITTTSAGAVSYSDTASTGNTATTNYSYYVRACNASGCSAATQTALVPFRPVAIKAALLATGIDLRWTDKSTNESSMILERKRGICAVNGAWTQVGVLPANTIAYTDTTAVKGRTYSYRVRSMAQSGSTPYAYGYSYFSNCADIADPVVRLPKTGQTTCYDNTGTVTDCAGTRQDGEFQAGIAWPAQRFVSGVGTESDCMIDQLTGLMWPKNGYLIGGDNNWQYSIDYANNLDLCGHTDWRMPNVLEMDSLFNAAQVNSPSWLNSQGFYSTRQRYWTSSTIKYATDRAWAVNLAGIITDESPKSATESLIPVRAGVAGAYINSETRLPRTGQTVCYDAAGAVTACAGTGQDGDVKAGQTWPSPRFSVIYCDYSGPCKNQAADCDAVTGNDMVTDNLTGLIWPRDLSPVGTHWWYPNSMSFCGFVDWRYPNRRELMSLLDWSESVPALPAVNPFEDILALTKPFWTSTTLPLVPGCASSVMLSYGAVDFDCKSDYDHIVYVRGGLQ